MVSRQQLRYLSEGALAVLIEDLAAVAQQQAGGMVEAAVVCQAHFRGEFDQLVGVLGGVLTRSLLYQRATASVDSGKAQV